MKGTMFDDDDDMLALLMILQYSKLFHSMLSVPLEYKLS